MANVTTLHTPQPAPGAKFTITLELEGFPVTVEVEGKADNLKAMVERLKAIGAQPPQSKPNAQPGPQNAPRCPIHSKQMKPSRKPGGFFCPSRNPDGSYCSESV